jgi:hypothetical protein
MVYWSLMKSLRKQHRWAFLMVWAWVATAYFAVCPTLCGHGDMVTPVEVSCHGEKDDSSHPPDESECCPDSTDLVLGLSEDGPQFFATTALVTPSYQVAFVSVWTSHVVDFATGPPRHAPLYLSKKSFLL